MHKHLAWKIVFLLCLPVMFQLLGSCCQCVETAYFTYYNCEILARNLDNSGIEAEHPSSDTITAAAYAIELSLRRSEALCQYKQPDFPLGLTGAYAISCDCPPEVLYEVENEIVAIRIISLEDFSNNFPAGTEISALFSYFDGVSYHSISVESLRLNEDLAYEVEQGDDWELLLMETPDELNRPFRFRIEMERLDGSILMAETSTIVLR
jgi:hypothetical protein